MSDFIKQLESSVPEMFTELWTPAAQQEGSQWVDARYAIGGNHHFEPLSNRSLGQLIDRIILKAAALTGVEVPPLPQEAAYPTDERNGVTPPKSGVTLRVWRIADKITQLGRDEGKPPASRANVIAVAKLEDIKEGTASSAYGKWAAYHGIDPKDSTRPFEPKQKKNQNAPASPTATTPPAAEDTRLLYLMHPESSSAFCGYRKELAEGTLIEIGFVGPNGPSQQEYQEACARAGILAPFPFDLPPPSSLPHQPPAEAPVTAAPTFAPPPPVPAYLPPPPPPPSYG